MTGQDRGVSAISPYNRHVERKHEVTRLEGFSDAVFGFALTLLVVSLEVPQNFLELQNLLRGFLPFALMFAMICWIWYEHQQFFRRYGLQDALTITLNCFLLFVVLFYVYPLKYLTMSLIGPIVHMTPESLPETSSGDGVLLLYSSGVVLIFGTFVALYLRAWRQRDAIGLTTEEQITLRSGMRGHLISAGLGVLSILIVEIARWTDRGWLVMVAGFSYALMGPLHAWNGHAASRAVAALRKKGHVARS